MGKQRKEVEEPQCDYNDYVVQNFRGYFFSTRWNRTPDWNIILKQVEKTRHASQMIDIHLYPSTLFLTALDMLETNLYVIDDLFYYMTCQRLIGGDYMSKPVLYTLGFWNMDCYKVLEQITKGLHQATKPLIESLKYEPIWDVALKIVEKGTLSERRVGSAPIPMRPYTEEQAYAYVCERHEAAQIDKDALVNQIDNILRLVHHYQMFFFSIYGHHIDFSELLEWFRKSERAQKEFIEPWRKDFGDTRDSLIAKMGKDPKLGPWVNRYDHLSKGMSVHRQLFYNGRTPEPINKEECYNTDNWISILTVAAVLQEYDEQHAQSEPPTTKPLKIDEEVLLTRLSVFIPDEVIAKKFVEAVKDMNDRQTIALVKHYKQYGQCVDTSKALWELLHEAGLYTAKYSNWSAQI